MLYFYGYELSFQSRHLKTSIYNNNQQQLFPSKLGRLEIKPHEKKNRYKTRAKKKEKTKGDKKTK
jgi:hypothetical protein